MNDTGTKLKRQRGRPSASKQAQQPAAYDFPSLDDIQRMTDAQVQACFEELGVQPKPFAWNEEDNQLSVALWHDYGMTMSDVDRMRTAPPLEDKAAMKSLRDASFSIYQRCLRSELMAAYIDHWVSTLDDTQLVQECERLSEDKLSESEKRYTKRSDLQERVTELVWPEIVSQSKLYQSPTNSLGG